MSEGDARTPSPLYVIDNPVGRSKYQERDVPSLRTPEPKKTPINWDGEKRPTVAIIVIDAAKKRVAYIFGVFGVQNCNNSLVTA